MEIAAAKNQPKEHFDRTPPEYRIENMMHVPLSLKGADHSEIFYEFADWFPDDEDDLLIQTAPALREIIGETSSDVIADHVKKLDAGFLVQCACPVRFYDCETGQYENTGWSNYHTQWVYVRDINDAVSIIEKWTESRVLWDIDRSFVK